MALRRASGWDWETCQEPRHTNVICAEAEGWRPARFSHRRKPIYMAFSEQIRMIFVGAPESDTELTAIKYPRARLRRN